MVIRSRKIKQTQTVCVDDAHRGWNDTKVPVCVYTHTAYVHYSNRPPPCLHLIVQCGADRGWVDGSSFPSFVRIKKCQCKPSPSQLVCQKEMEEDINATVLMEDDPSVDSPPATNYTNERKVDGVEGANRIAGGSQERMDGSVDLHASNNGSQENDRNESLIASLVSPKAYTYELAFEKLGQLEMIEKGKEKAFMRDVVTPDTSRPSAEEEPKNI
jgi:hypothetical protein